VDIRVSACGAATESSFRVELFVQGLSVVGVSESVETHGRASETGLKSTRVGEEGWTFWTGGSGRPFGGLWGGRSLRVKSEEKSRGRWRCRWSRCPLLVVVQVVGKGGYFVNLLNPQAKVVSTQQEK
jgi:hypothetical protein